MRIELFNVFATTNGSVNTGPVELTWPWRFIQREPSHFEVYKFGSIIERRSTISS